MFSQVKNLNFLEPFNQLINELMSNTSRGLTRHTNDILIFLVFPVIFTNTLFTLDQKDYDWMCALKTH